MAEGQKYSPRQLTPDIIGHGTYTIAMKVKGDVPLGGGAIALGFSSPPFPGQLLLVGSPPCPCPTPIPGALWLLGSGLLGLAGTTARGHEFHYSEIVGEPDGVPRLYRLTPRRGGAAVSEGYSKKNVLASYVHLHFGSNPEVARHLVASCRAYKDSFKEEST